jgi:DNA-directed RNA polymerase III subunit RPC1
MCQIDGFVVIRNSELLCGNICKATLGGGKKGLIYNLIQTHSNHDAAVLVNTYIILSCVCFCRPTFPLLVQMNRFSKLSARWLGNRGFSIGITDVTPSKSLNALKKKLLNTGYAECEQNIKNFKEGTLAVRFLKQSQLFTLLTCF